MVTSSRGDRSEAPDNVAKMWNKPKTALCTEMWMSFGEGQAGIDAPGSTMSCTSSKLHRDARRASRYRPRPRVRAHVRLSKQVSKRVDNHVAIANSARPKRLDESRCRIRHSRFGC